MERSENRTYTFPLAKLYSSCSLGSVGHCSCTFEVVLVVEKLLMLAMVRVEGDCQMKMPTDLASKMQHTATVPQVQDHNETANSPVMTVHTARVHAHALSHLTSPTKGTSLKAIAASDQTSSAVNCNRSIANTLLNPNFPDTPHKKLSHTFQL